VDYSSSQFEAAMAPRTILVADEDIDTRIILRALLERHGYRIVDAATPQEAMAAAAQDISLVIMNHPIPIGPATTLAGWLRAQPQTRDVPIINLTSRTIPHFAEEAARQGVNITLAKPLDVHRLTELVNQLAGQLVAH
jgi:CheY-like chemotaxis protein